MQSDRWKRVTAGLAAMFAVNAAAPPPVATPAPSTVAAPSIQGHPALWKLSDRDTTIYLFGTIHLLPPGTKWRTRKIEEAMARSHDWVLEVALGDDPMKAAQVMQTMGRATGLPPLLDRVPAAKRGELKALFAKFGLPEGSLDGLKTWAASIVLLGVSLTQMGMDPSQGVEMTISKEVEQQHKPIIGLETAEFQFGIFDHLSEDSQRTFLGGVLDDPAKMQAEFHEMLRAWLTGDVDSIARTFNTEENLSPELRDLLLKKRNATWTQWLTKRLQQPGTIFVAVGAGHLAGSDSVPAMLKAKGLHIERVE